MSSLTVSKLVDAIVVLQRMADLQLPIDPAQLGKLRADAFCASSALRHCGLDEMTVEMRADKEAA
jgi:hypothetical protein